MSQKDHYFCVNYPVSMPRLNVENSDANNKLYVIGYVGAIISR